jgi:hypothetical protein
MLKVFKLFRFVKSMLDAPSFCQARKRKAKSLDSPHSFLNLPDPSNTTLLCCISCETCAIFSPQATKAVVSAAQLFNPRVARRDPCIERNLQGGFCAILQLIKNLKLLFVGCFGLRRTCPCSKSGWQRSQVPMKRKKGLPPLSPIL